MPYSELIARRIPKCPKCRNHGYVSIKKGHKKYCEYEDCKCIKCVLIDEKRYILRTMIRLRRNQA